jgi:hypothetical protein
MVVLLLHMVSPTTVKSKCLYALSKVLDFYDLENPRYLAS